MGYQGGIILHVLDTTGVEIQPPVLAHDFLSSSAVRDKNNYVILPPHQFLGTRQAFAISELVRTPGRYRLLAEYHCPDPKYASISNFWGIDRPSIVSGELELNIE